MKAKDIAWLASVAADSKLIYDRQDEVVNELQAIFSQAKDRQISSVSFEVKTSWAEEQDKKADQKKNG